MPSAAAASILLPALLFRASSPCLADILDRHSKTPLDNSAFNGGGLLSGTSVGDVFADREFEDGGDGGGGEGGDGDGEGDGDGDGPDGEILSEGCLEIIEDGAGTALSFSGADLSSATRAGVEYRYELTLDESASSIPDPEMNVILSDLEDAFSDTLLGEYYGLNGDNIFCGAENVAGDLAAAGRRNRRHREDESGGGRLFRMRGRRAQQSSAVVVGLSPEPRDAESEEALFCQTPPADSSHRCVPIDGGLALFLRDDDDGDDDEAASAEAQRAHSLMSAAMLEGEYLSVDDRIVSLGMVPRTSAAMETATKVGSSGFGPAAAAKERAESEGFSTLAVLGMVLAPIFLLGMLVVLLQNRRSRSSASHEERGDAGDFDNGRDNEYRAAAVSGEDYYRISAERSKSSLAAAGSNGNGNDAAEMNAGAVAAATAFTAAGSAAAGRLDRGGDGDDSADGARGGYMGMTPEELEHQRYVQSVLSMPTILPPGNRLMSPVTEASDERYSGAIAENVEEDDNDHSDYSDYDDDNGYDDDDDDEGDWDAEMTAEELDREREHGLMTMDSPPATTIPTTAKRGSFIAMKWEGGSTTTTTVANSAHSTSLQHHHSAAAAAAATSGDEGAAAAASGSLRADKDAQNGRDDGAAAVVLLNQNMAATNSGDAAGDGGIRSGSIYRGRWG